MDSIKQLKKLEKEMKIDHKKDVGFRYPSKDGGGSNYERYLEYYNETLSGELHPLWIIDIFQSQHSWYLDNATYQILKIEDKEKGIEYFRNASAYAYLTLLVQEGCFECEKAVSQQFQNIHTGSVWMSEVLLCGWEEEYQQIGEWFIESIAYGKKEKSENSGIYINKLIISGDEDALVGWFLFDLYCKVYNRSYDESKAKYPKNMLFFKEILENWNTKDMAKVEQYVYLMCEYHLEQTQEEVGEDDYFVFDSAKYWLFPVEVLAWLKLREIHGVENPKEFAHHLMQGEVAKTLYTMRTPLEKPKELPYVVGLFKKFQEELCPDVKPPKWIKFNEKEIPKIYLKSRELAPKTGCYQATLPKEHPRAEFLKNSGFDTKRVKEGETIGTFGLSGGDEELIVWVYLGE